MAKWTKQTYEMVAEVLLDADSLHDAAESFAHRFKNDNPNFSRSRFMEACGVEVTPAK